MVKEQFNEYRDIIKHQHFDQKIINIVNKYVTILIYIFNCARMSVCKNIKFNKRK